MIKKTPPMGFTTEKAFGAEINETIVREIEKEDYLPHMIFISFDWNNLVELRRLLPSCKVQFLTSKWDDALCERLAANGFDLDILYSELTAERVKMLHRAGIEVNCWTCDKKDHAETLVAYGVDYLTSNILE